PMIAMTTNNSTSVKPRGDARMEEPPLGVRLTTPHPARTCPSRFRRSHQSKGWRDDCKREAHDHSHEIVSEEARRVSEGATRFSLAYQRYATACVDGTPPR